MREILFRGKRKDNKEWIEGYYAVIGTRHVIIKAQSEDYYSVDDSPKKGHGNEIIEVEPETIRQYTGVTDKNGRKIFEGDIVKDDSVRLKGGIKFSERYLQFMVDDINDGEQDYAEFMEKVEVIGNIFDNSELLKEDSENANPAN